MALVSTRSAGLAAVRARLAALPAAGRAAAQGALLEAARAAASDLRAGLVTGSGASVPGEAPADPKGNIAAAVTASLDEDGHVSVTVALPYARDLEFGTRRMAARPFLRPAAERAGQGAGRRVAGAVATALKEPNP